MLDEALYRGPFGILYFIQNWHSLVIISGVYSDVHTRRIIGYVYTMHPGVSVTTQIQT